MHFLPIYIYTFKKVFIFFTFLPLGKSFKKTNFCICLDELIVTFLCKHGNDNKM